MGDRLFLHMTPYLLCSILWLKGNSAKILIGNLYGLKPDDTVERVLAHIMKYEEQTDFSFPEEIYLEPVINFK
jgi:hypothetical protein